MSKAAFDKIVAGLEDAISIAKGTADPADYRIHVPATVDVRAIRKRMRLSQERFAHRYGFSVGRIRDWEQGRSPIDPPSRVLLTIIDREPEAVERALSA
jgi:putative transcriptional regulator